MEAHSWGISDSTFLAGFAIVCGVYLVAVLVLARLHGVSAHVAQRDHAALELAMLTEGGVCALTAAVVRLHEVGALRVEQDRFVPTGESAPAGALEREIIDMLRRDPAASAHKLRSELADGPAVTVLAAALAAEGLLRSPLRSRALRRLEALAWAITAVAFIRFVFAVVDPPDGPMSDAAATSLCIGLFLPTLVMLARGRGAGASRAGRTLLAGERERHRALQTATPAGDELVLAVALFGSEPLRRARPELASAWGIISPDELATQAAMLS